MSHTPLEPTGLPVPEKIVTQRTKEWPEKLNEYLNEASQKPFVWGVHDCCTFVADAVEIVCGIDYMGGLRGQYHSREESEEMFLREGYIDLLGFLEQKFGPPVVGLQGSRGDIAYYDGCLGIIVGTQAVFLHEQGLGLLRLNKIEKVFKVPA